MKKDKELLNFRKKDFAHLSVKQSLVRDSIRAKIGREYPQIEMPCICEAYDDMLIVLKDRYELPFGVVMCKSCGLMRLKPCLSPESLKQFYKKDYWNLYMGDGEVEPEKYFQNMILRGSYIKDIFDAYAKCNWRNMRVLEVGCQAGGILVPFLNAGAYARGYDYDTRYLDYGKSQHSGLDLRMGGFDDAVGEKEKFDLIILNHVLEHLTKPLEVVSGLRERLNDKGFLYIALPGAMNPGFYLSPTKSIVGGFHVSHLYYFTVATLEQCLAGFNVIYKDNKIRMICQRGKEKFSCKMKPNDCKQILSFIRWYEGSFWGRIYRCFFAVWERYYNPIVRRIYSLKFISRKFFILFTY